MNTILIIAGVVLICAIWFGEECKDHVGNVYFFNKNYREGYSCKILPIITIKEN